jgi:hypothetical protein
VRFSPFRTTAILIALAAGSGAFAEQTKLVLGKYESALKLMDQGKCDQAREMLAPGGKLGAGEEVAISDIGDCYLSAAAKQQNPAEAQRMRETGAGWILRAANLGTREAQATAVKLYLNGQVFFTDPYEAAKWYTLWAQNRANYQFGQVEFDPNWVKVLNGYGPDVWNEAKTRAASWKPTATSRADAP